MSEEDPVGRLIGFGPPTLGPSEVCERAGVDREVGDALWRALGFPDVPEGVLAYTEEDARALRLATEGLEELEPEARAAALQLILQEARVLSAHLAALAATELDAMAALQARGLRRRLIQQASQHGLEGSDLDWLITYALRRQLGAVARRESSGGLDPAQAGEELCVGFVDLSDFTVLSARTELDAIGTLLHTFESLAFDVIAETPGRVVKLIGDEVMFVAVDATSASEIALELVERFGKEGRVTPRGGVAFGEVLTRGGDYYGPVVNLASRIAELAVPNEILVTDEVRARSERALAPLHFDAAGRRMLKGFDEPVELFALRRG